MESREYLKPAEAAAFLRVSQPTLMRWRASGTGPRFVKIGPLGRGRGTVLYRVEDLRAFLDEHMRVSTSEAAPLLAAAPDVAATDVAVEPREA